MKDIDDKATINNINPDMIQDLNNFHTKFEFNKESMTKDKLAFRCDLLMEEVNEMHDAIATKNPEELTDALIDIIYIALGTLDLARVDTAKAWSDVQRANMSKVRGVKPGREQSGGFDVIKPFGWTGPDHAGNTGQFKELLRG